MKYMERAVLVPWEQLLGIYLTTDIIANTAVLVFDCDYLGLTGLHIPLSEYKLIKNKLKEGKKMRICRTDEKTKCYRANVCTNKVSKPIQAMRKKYGIVD